jgi:hypothetical protein
MNKQPAIRVVALAICPRCKSEVTELTMTHPAYCVPCWHELKRKPRERKPYKPFSNPRARDFREASNNILRSLGF